MSKLRISESTIEIDDIVQDLTNDANKNAKLTSLQQKRATAKESAMKVQGVAMRQG
jgi:hypothetical protein